jgi:DNA-binding transcriptional regulator YiaG
MTGNDVKKIREALKETQSQFASRLGYANYQRVQELEARGKRKIPAQSAWRISALKLDHHLR